MPHIKEVLFEFHPIGRQIKVSAIDPITLTEVCIFGPLNTPQHQLELQAYNKLKYVLSKPLKNKEK